MEKTFKIIDPAGIHARPASVITKVAMGFQSDSKLKFGDKEGNLKSIMSIMSLGVKQNDDITLVVEGPDAEEAMSKIEASMSENKIV